MTCKPWIIALLLLPGAAGAQSNLPIIKTNVTRLDVRDGADFRKARWSIAPQAKPDVFSAALENGEPHRVTFYTDVDSIGFLVELGKSYDFLVVHGADTCWTRIVGERFTPAAVFDPQYQKEHRGKILVLVPEVYELVNIAIALTPFGMAKKNYVYQGSPYYAEVRQWFGAYQNHPLVMRIDSAIQRNEGMYVTLKMNGYAFDFDGGGRIVKSAVYDRTGGGRVNALEPYLADLQSFADASRFREFYRQHDAFYDGQIAFYRDTANLAEMKRWLDRQFPRTRAYDGYKVVFSPLVAYNQSSIWFTSNGYSELQPHVNFFYHEDVQRIYQGKLTPQVEALVRGDIVFTEINHGYINPEGEKYGARVSQAIRNRDRWVDPQRGPDYYRGDAPFYEYLNWALISLRYVDYVPRAEQDRLIAMIDQTMTDGRGFPAFKEFDTWLVETYRNRKPEQTIADLYPAILDWFAAQGSPPRDSTTLVDSIYFDDSLPFSAPPHRRLDRSR